MTKTEKKTSLQNSITDSAHLFEKKLIVACSGGPDSMVLLDLLCKSKEQNYSDSIIVVAHVNHQLRDTALRDEKIVRDYCEKNHITMEVLTVDVQKEAKKTKTTVEECARNIRIQWLEEIRIKHLADRIVTAHHGDDQAETILYRITKGTGITGLVGIESSREKYSRPLLSATKSEILEYAKDNKIPYWHDETNDDITIPRNMLRHEILPRLSIINPEVWKSLMRLSQSARELKISFDDFFQGVLEKKSFTLDWYHELPLGFQHELLRCLYERANGSTHGLSTSLIEELDRFLSTRNGGKKEIGKMSITKKSGIVYLLIW